MDVGTQMMTYILIYQGDMMLIVNDILETDVYFVRINLCQMKFQEELFLIQIGTRRL